jgi:nitric oxide reductase large subunit
MNNLFSKLLYQDLPTDYYWLDRLDILRAVRIMPKGYTKKGVYEYYSLHTGYICVGIKENSEIHKKAIDFLESAKISRFLLQPNEFLEGYLRLPLNDEKSINEGAFATETGNIPFSNEHKQALKDVLSIYAHDPHLQTQVQENFIRKWDSFESLHKFRLWWDTIPHAFEITSVGSILAHTNAKRCDPDLPVLITNWEKQS